MQDFRQLKVWGKSHQLTLELYRLTAAFPPSELYGLTSQIRRSAASIPANLAEGCGRATARDFGRFVTIASGSASELEYHLLLARDLGFLSEEAYRPVAQAVIQVKRMLFGLERRLTTDN